MYLIIEVTQENRDVFYYKFQVQPGDSDNTLSGNVSIGSLTVTPGTPNATATSAQAVVVRPESALTNVTVSATVASPNAAVAYAITAAAAAVPVFGSGNSFTFGTGSTWLYVRVTAQTGDVKYYRFQIAIGNGNTNLNTVTVSGNTPSSLGTPGDTNAVVAANRGAVVIPALTAGVVITATAEASTSSVAWASAAEIWGTMYLSGEYGTDTVTLGQSGYFNYNILVIQVTAQDGSVAYYVLTVTSE